MTRKHVSSLFGLSLAVALGVSCSSNGGGAPASVAGYCEQRARRECELVADRCVVDKMACQTARQGVCMSAATAAMQDPERPFNAGSVPACIGKIGEVYGKPTITAADRASVSQICGRVFSGTKKLDEPCTSSFSCEPSLICDAGYMTCAPQKTVAASAACGNPGETCPPGQHCVNMAGIRRCMARGMTGATCASAEECLEMLRCNGGTCAERVGIGMSCPSGDADCGSSGPYCDGVAAVCTTGFTPALNVPECGSFGATGGGTGGSSGGGSGGSSGGGSGGAGATDGGGP
jgi:uncharacterized membrane protein YgcG